MGGESLLSGYGRPSFGLILVVIGLATGAVTLAGGVLALKFRSYIGVFLAFSSGAVIGVALFDLLPEALQLNLHFRAPLDIAAAVAAGVAAYLAFDRVPPIINAGAGAHRGHLGAGSLTLHSLADGLGIGLAFKVSAAAGAIVALAVLTHDLVDGVNTVTFSLSGGTGQRAARRWLVADAIAPIVGIGLSCLIVVPQAILAVLLALFAGFFLGMGSTGLLAGKHQGGVRVSNAAAAILGLVLIYTVVKLAGG